MVHSSERFKFRIFEILFFNFWSLKWCDLGFFNASQKFRCFKLSYKWEWEFRILCLKNKASLLATGFVFILFLKTCGLRQWKQSFFFFVYNNVILLKITFKLHLIIVFLLFISVSLDTNTNLSRVILLKVWYFLYIINKNKTRALLSNTKNALFLFWFYLKLDFHHDIQIRSSIIKINVNRIRH